MERANKQVNKSDNFECDILIKNIMLKKYQKINILCH